MKLKRNKNEIKKIIKIWQHPSGCPNTILVYRDVISSPKRF
jgi:sarcosine oxidase delta subunit